MRSETRKKIIFSDPRPCSLISVLLTQKQNIFENNESRKIGKMQPEIATRAASMLEDQKVYSVSIGSKLVDSMVVEKVNIL